MKEPYAESTVYQKYRKTGIDKNKIKAIKECLNACSNFYKVIELDEALMIVRRELAKLYGVDNSGSKVNRSTGSKLNTEACEITTGSKMNTEALQNNGKTTTAVSIESSTQANTGSKMNTDDVNRRTDVLTSSEINALVPIFERDSKLDFYLELESELYDDGKDVLLLIDKEYLCVRNSEFTEADISGFVHSRNTGEPYDGPYPFEEDWDIFYELDELRQDKGIFIPADLMKYAEPYFPETPQVKAMRNFLVGLEITITNAGVDGRSGRSGGVDNSRSASVDNVDDRINVADMMIYNMHTFIRDVHTPPAEAFPIMLDVMKASGYKLSMSELERCMDLFTDLSNNTRMPCNGGYTPNELMKKMGRMRPGMRPGLGGGSPHSTSLTHALLEGIRNGELDGNGLKQMIMGIDDLPIKDSLLKEIDMVMKEIEKNDKPEMAGDQNIGRNAPCPCGSGKKYKHCCGKLN